VNVTTVTIVANRIEGRPMSDDVTSIERRLDSGDWLPPGDVAALLDTTRASVDRWLRDGVRDGDGRRQLRYRTTPGGHRKVHPEDVRWLLDRHRQVHGDTGSPPSE
jgi:hypothetical protein